MSIREIAGITYSHLPNYGRKPCTLCGRATRMEARQSGNRQKWETGSPVCGLCWEDEPEGVLIRIVHGSEEDWP